jgi:hypothetical protein
MSTSAKRPCGKRCCKTVEKCALTQQHVSLVGFRPLRANSCIAAAAAKGERAMWETLREAIDEEMEADPTVLVMGAMDR